MDCNPTEFIEKMNLQYKRKFSNHTVNIWLSFAGEEQCELLTFTVVFWHNKILKFWYNCEQILSYNRHDVTDSYLKMSSTEQVQKQLKEIRKN